jgi:hypothetical protein
LLTIRETVARAWKRRWVHLHLLGQLSWLGANEQLIKQTNYNFFGCVIDFPAGVNRNSFSNFKLI